ncbi:MAG: c-type cytochrome, partial [Acidobacteriota bacterium]|nr:c-type cytochrome [Acidobacteriota bacterium]
MTAAVLLGQEDHGLTLAEIQRGGEMYLTNCATCHGPDGDRVAGVDLASNRFRRAQTDSELYAIIQKGIPGTPMPPGNYNEFQLRGLVGYLHSMAALPRTANVGDPVRGKEIFEGKGNCMSCHRIGSRGGFAAPDLGEIGIKRRGADLERSIVDPNA